MKKTVKGRVLDDKSERPIQNAQVVIKTKEAKSVEVTTVYTDKEGRFSAEYDDAKSVEAHARAFGKTLCVGVSADCKEMIIRLQASDLVKMKLWSVKECGTPVECPSPVTHQTYELQVETNADLAGLECVGGPESAAMMARQLDASGFNYEISAAAGGDLPVNFMVRGQPWPNGLSPGFGFQQNFRFRGATQPPVGRIALQRSATRPTGEENLWTLIRANSRAINFNNYFKFINDVLCREQDDKIPQDSMATGPGRRFQRERTELISRFGVGVYELLRTATEFFLLLHCRVNSPRFLSPDELAEENARRQVPTSGDLRGLAQRFLGNNAYLDHVVDAAFPGLPPGGPFCDNVLFRNDAVLIELIWSYWLEEGMLAQSVNALARRFQNVRSPGGRDPLAHFELDPLRPMNNILWGYVQEEFRRLTVPRRSLEYSHHYGLSLYGKAVSGALPADPRSKFLESFHNLLHRCAQFYREDNDTTVIADGFPLLNALKEVHLILAQGAHNQFGDLPWTARVEMLIQQWMMARPETRDFLQSRVMVPFTEAWMPQVDTMKGLQGWTDVSVATFNDLATFGEQILLSIRYGDWINIHDEDVAKNWARYFRPEIQSYLHAYRAVSGVDLSTAEGVDFTIPAVHLQRRLATQQQARLR